MLTICIILIVLLALDLLFTLALRCRKGHPKWELLKKYRYAHRGFHDKPVIPENSLPAFRRAIEHGFGAELAVPLLKDGTLAVFHDSDLRRCANVDGQIEDLTLEELKQLRLEGTDEQIPTFDEVLAIGPVPMMKFVCRTTQPFGVHTMVSLNPIMVDGTGMCGGCRVTVGGETKFACVDGPEIDGHQVDFAELTSRNGTYRDREAEVKENHVCRIESMGKALIK